MRAGYLKTKVDALRLVHGQEQGYRAWYFILVDRMKLPLFEKALGGDDLNLKRFGTLLDSGWGEVPPEDVLKEMEKLFS